MIIEAAEEMTAECPGSGAVGECLKGGPELADLHQAGGAGASRHGSEGTSHLLGEILCRCPLGAQC